jgi:hypothetical protein
MKNFMSVNKGLIILILVFIAVSVISGFGNHGPFILNHDVSKSKTSVNLDDQAILYAVDAIINSKVTTLPKKCLSVLNVEKKSDIITFGIYEIHGGDCPGDQNTSPLVTMAQVNVKTKEVGVQTDYRYPFEIKDQYGKATDYSGDKGNIYYKNKIVSGADPKTFEYISREKTESNGVEADGLFDGFGRDKKHVYVNGLMISGADIDTFKISSNGLYALDINHNYSYNEKKKAFEIDENPCLGIIDCRE